MSDQTPSVQITLSLQELKSLIHDAVREALLEVMGEDAKSDPEFAPEIAERLQRYKIQSPVTIPVNEVEKALGLDD